MKVFFDSIVVLLVLFCCGCQTASVNTISVSNSSTVINKIDDSRLDIDSKLLAQLQFLEIRTTRTNDGFMRVQAFFRNATGGLVKARYRFNWYDAKGVEILKADTEFWEQAVILKGDDVVFTSIAPERTCSDFKLRIICVEK